MTLAREQWATEGTASALRAHADAEPHTPPPSPGRAEAGAGPGRRSGVGRVPREGEGRAFQCRTCSRRFPSFQALGGHRTGHTRLQARHALPQQQHAVHGHRARAHWCAVCGLEFPVGQALGGHMRRHKGEARVEEEQEQQEMPDLNHPPLEDRGGDRGQEERSSESEPRLLDLLV